MSSLPPETPQPYPAYQPYGTTPPMLESEARMYAMLCHALAFVAGFLAPLVIWLIFRERSALIDHHGKQQLNFQISALIYGIAMVLIVVATLGFGAILIIPLAIAYSVFAFVIVIMAAIKAYGGEYYRIPLTIQFLR